MTCPHKLWTCDAQASDQHPLYITTSSLGGAGRGLNAGEVIMAGGDSSYGTLTQPYTLKWTPNTCAPAGGARIGILVKSRPTLYRSLPRLVRWSEFPL